MKDHLIFGLNTDSNLLLPVVFVIMVYSVQLYIALRYAQEWRWRLSLHASQPAGRSTQA